MFIINFFKGLFQYFNLQERRAHITFLGLDNAGKTSLLQRLKYGTFKQLDPTVFSHREEVKIGNIKCQAVDMGGHLAVRKTWKNYIQGIDCIIFLVDSVNKERFQESYEELHTLFTMIGETPLAILGNKIDIKGAVDYSELEQQLKVTQSDLKELGLSNQVKLFMCSVAKQAGYQEAFQWMDSQIKIRDKTNNKKK